MIFSWLRADIAAWIPVTFFFIGPWAQIIQNYRTKNTQGVSHRSVFLICTGLSFIVIYNFFMHLPLAYRVMHPLVLLTWLTMALQEYVYSKNARIRTNMQRSYGALAVGAIAFFIWGRCNPLEYGAIAGWIGALFLAVFQAPQVVKNLKRRSVEGLSLTYLSVLAVGSSVELSIAYWKLLPLQSVLNAVRGIGFYLVFVYQFVRYNRVQRSVKRKAK